MARLSGVVRHGPRVQAWEDQSNQVADALSRKKAELASFFFVLLEEIAAMSQLKGAIPERKIEGLEKDPAEKREQLQLEVPLEWNGCWCSISYPPPVGELPIPFLSIYEVKVVAGVTV